MNIQEFAARLKLSVSTVSKAMNGREDVSAATRERVLAAASRVGRAGCARFIALGHRRIALVHSPEFLMFSHHQRVGYEAALRAAGIEFDPALCVEEAISEEGGVAAARRLLDLHDPPTAIVCGHDLVALGVIRAIGETGRTAGTDVGVIGGDDHPIGRYISPALTTFSAETHRAGKRMVEMLLARLAGTPASALQEVWTPELIVRASDGPRRVPATLARPVSAGGTRRKGSANV